MTYHDGSQVAIGDTVRLPGWGYIFEVVSQCVGGSQVMIRNVTPGFTAVGTSSVGVRATSSRCGTWPANRTGTQCTTRTSTSPSARHIR